MTTKKDHSIDLGEGGEGDLTSQTPRNATRADLERLNGLLIRALIEKLETDKATATDIGNAVKVVVHNRVSPKEPEGHLGWEAHLAGDTGFSELDWPVKVTDDLPEDDDKDQRG
ncbi:MAG TPA: hypothetical protein DIU07_19815 [Rhodobacteraceae bacterium]|nr:hypothetical protein [Paracoccaceae bacterium]